MSSKETGLKLTSQDEKLTEHRWEQGKRFIMTASNIIDYPFLALMGQCYVVGLAD